MIEFIGKLTLGFFRILAVVTAVIFIVIIGTLFGALGGWIVGLFFTETIMGTLARFGVQTLDFKMWQLGATLGFISGFFKSSSFRSAMKESK